PHREVLADHGRILRNLLGGAELVEPGHQGVADGVRHGERARAAVRLIVRLSSITAVTLAPASRRAVITMRARALRTQSVSRRRNSRDVGSIHCTSSKTMIGIPSDRRDAHQSSRASMVRLRFSLEPPATGA